MVFWKAEHIIMEGNKAQSVGSGGKGYQPYFHLGLGRRTACALEFPCWNVTVSLNTFKKVFSSIILESEYTGLQLFISLSSKSSASHCGHNLKRS
jgi:hypothetical protein